MFGCSSFYAFTVQISDMQWVLGCGINIVTCVIPSCGCGLCGFTVDVLAAPNPATRLSERLVSAEFKLT